MSDAPERVFAWKDDDGVWHTRWSMHPFYSTYYERADLVPQWRSIETAPKGGRRIIAWDPTYWGREGGTSGEALWIGLSKRWQLIRDPHSQFNPTLWMPFPEPPAARTENESV